MRSAFLPQLTLHRECLLVIMPLCVVESFSALHSSLLNTICCPIAHSSSIIYSALSSPSRALSPRLLGGDECASLGPLSPARSWSFRRAAGQRGFLLTLNDVDATMVTPCPLRKPQGKRRHHSPILTVSSSSPQPPHPLPLCLRSLVTQYFLFIYFFFAFIYTLSYNYFPG